MEVGWSELLVIAIVALVVIGPKDLPEMFRTLGRFSAKMRAMARDFSRAMEDAGKETGLSDVADDLRKVTSPRSMGLDAVKAAADKFEKWDPMKGTRPTVPSAAPPSVPPTVPTSAQPITAPPLPKFNAAALAGVGSAASEAVSPPAVEAAHAVAPGTAGGAGGEGAPVQTPPANTAAPVEVATTKLAAPVHTPFDIEAAAAQAHATPARRPTPALPLTSDPAANPAATTSAPTTTKSPGRLRSAPTTESPQERPEEGNEPL